MGDLRAALLAIFDEHFDMGDYGNGYSDPEGAADAVLAALAASQEPESGGLAEALRGDGPCADCGTLDNIVWFTDNVFWNAVTGENVVHEESRAKIICVTCFVQRTADAGLHPTGWRLLPDWPWREHTDGQ